MYWPSWQFVADEDGFLSVIKTSAPKVGMWGSRSYVWSCHHNSIFDTSMTGGWIRYTQIHRYTCLLPLFWSDGDELIATASGDQSIKIWDLSASYPVLRSTLNGHVSSVKAVKFRPGSLNELISGAREGNIFLWDKRAYSGRRNQCEVGLMYESVHFNISLEFLFWLISTDATQPIFSSACAADTCYPHQGKPMQRTTRRIRTWPSQRDKCRLPQRHNVRICRCQWRDDQVLGPPQDLKFFQCAKLSFYSWIFFLSCDLRFPERKLAFIFRAGFQRRRIAFSLCRQ